MPGTDSDSTGPTVDDLDEVSPLTRYPTVPLTVNADKSNITNVQTSGSTTTSTAPLSKHATNASYRVTDIYGDKTEQQIMAMRQQTRDTVLSLLPQGDIEEYEREAAEDENSPRDGGEFQQIDPELVTWDGPDDPENPRNWPPRSKTLATVMVSLYTFISPLSSSIISPAVQKVSLDLGITNSTVQALLVSIFILAWAITPLFVAPFSEVFGRKLVLDISIIFLLIFNLACGGAKTVAQLLVFRFLAGVGGAAPLSVGAGTLSDLFDNEQRNSRLAWYSLGPTLGPVIAPIISGWISEYLHWRWIFWILGIVNGVSAVVCISLFRETYPPVLLARKAKRLRKESGNPNLHTLWELSQPSFTKLLMSSVVRPLKMLAVNIIIQGLGLFMAVTYGYLYLILTCFPALWYDYYKFKSGIAGMLYLGPGIGACIGIYFWTVMIQRTYLGLSKKNRGVSKPEFRLFWLPWISVSMAIGLFWYGWSAQARIHWIMPDIGVGIFFFGLVGVFQCIQNYLIDMNPKYAASAVGAAAVFRSCFGFGIPLVGKTMYKKLGYGWANTVCAFVDLALGIPFPLFMFYYGERLRIWTNIHVYKEKPEGTDEKPEALQTASTESSLGGDSLSR